MGKIADECGRKPIFEALLGRLFVSECTNHRRLSRSFSREVHKPRLEQLEYRLLLSVGAESAADGAMDRITLENGQELFMSGVNVAWCPKGTFPRVDFGNDINHIDDPNVRAWFMEMIDSVAAAGGNSLRWWLHPDGSPLAYNGYEDRMVTGITPEQINNIRTVLDYALKKNVLVNLCLWSFDMVNDGGWGEKYGQYKIILTDPDHLNAYINNFLRPLVREFADHAGSASDPVTGGLNTPIGADDLLIDVLAESSMI